MKLQLIDRLPVIFLASFVWLIILGGILVCMVAKNGDPPYGSTWYYLLVRPAASVAPVLCALWAIAILGSRWSDVSTSSKALLILGLAIAVALCCWTFYTVFLIQL